MSGGSLTVKDVTIARYSLDAYNYIETLETSYMPIYRNTVFAGGVVGSVITGSTVDIKSVAVTSFATHVEAESAYIGGLVGDGRSVNIATSSVNSLVSTLRVFTKGYFGGIAGYLGNSVVDNASAAVACTFYQPSSRFHFSFGGLVGFMDGDLKTDYNNVSSITNSTATVNASGLTNNSSSMICAVSYAVGCLKNSTEKGIQTSGNISFTGTTLPSTWGDKYGVAYGSAKVENVTTSGTTIGSGMIESHVAYNDSGHKIGTPISPRV